MDEGTDQKDALLREQAQKRLREKGPLQKMMDKDAAELLEELMIHQEELNIQNEELKDAQLRLEASKAKYFQLYDLAPLGYVTLTPDLLIKEANLGASKLLGIERSKLMTKPLSRFVSTKCHELMYLHLGPFGW